jgi:RNA polymerase sigma-70 factor (ECF subfamily)
MEDKQMLAGVMLGDKKVYELLYHRYYVFLCHIAEHITRDIADSEEIVSDVFLKLWNNRETIQITSSLRSYLVRAVQNTAINYLEKNKSKYKTTSLDSIKYSLILWDNDYPLGHLYEQEVAIILERNINALPENCREIFTLSRNHDLTYQEIADKLGISINTVKTQIKIAIARLREGLKDYLNIIILLLILK